MERFGSVEPQYLPIAGENCIKFAPGTLNFLPAPIRYETLIITRISQKLESYDNIGIRFIRAVRSLYTRYALAIQYTQAYREQQTFYALIPQFRSNKGQEKRR